MPIRSSKNSNKPKKEKYIQSTNSTIKGTEKFTGATCARNKDKNTTQELIQYHLNKISLISDQNENKKLGKKVINKYNNKPLSFQKMLTENEGQCKSMTP